MYHLQATVNEQHGEYDVRVYLWSREQSGESLLLFDDGYTFTPMWAGELEHEEILRVISRVCLGIADKEDGILF